MAEETTTTCPKCGAISGDDWSQCKGSCPIPGTPHFKPEELARETGRQLEKLYPFGYRSEDNEP